MSSYGNTFGADTSSDAAQNDLDWTNAGADPDLLRTISQRISLDNSAPISDAQPGAPSAAPLGNLAPLPSLAEAPDQAPQGQPTLDEVALSPGIGLKPSDLHDIRTAATTQVALQTAARAAAEAGVGALIPQTAGYRAAKHLYDAAELLQDNALDPIDQQQIEDTYNDMLSKRINDALIMRNNGANIALMLQMMPRY